MEIVKREVIACSLLFMRYVEAAGRRFCRDRLAGGEGA